MKKFHTNQYDEELSQKYSVVYQLDFPHRFMVYNTWLEEVGDVKGKRVLDLACGSGISSREIANRGAEVTGVDISESMLDEAKRIEKQNPLGIKYLFGDVSILTTYSAEKFDMATAAFLLHYADSVDVLQKMITNISHNLKDGCEFISINLNPVHPIVDFGPGISHSAVWIDSPFVDGSKLETTLYNKDGSEICKFINFYWSKKTLEDCFANAGFEKVDWIEMRMHEDGKKYPNWEILEKQNNLVVIRAKKQTDLA